MKDQQPSIISRRNFCKQTATAAMLAVTTSQAIAIEEKEVEQTIDCHPHFYDPSRPQGVPWPSQKSPIYRTVLPKDLKALEKPREVTGVVIVEASKWMEDNQWLLDIAKDDPFIVGIVGNLKPGTENFKKHLTRFAANPLYRGIRVSHKLIGEQHLENKAWQKDIKLFIDKDLSLDVNGSPEMAKAVANLAKHYPDLRIVINHVSNLVIDGKKPPSDWTANMRAASQHKNVFCKVSALMEGAMRCQAVKKSGKVPTNLEFYKPTLDVVWNAFGDDKLIFGSNWPVSERAGSYANLQQLVIDYVTPKGKEVTKKFFAGNAKLAYKWLDRKS